MKRSGIMAVLMLAGGLTAAAAQQPDRPMPVTPEPESLRYLPGPGPDPERMRQLRQQVEERFGRMVQARLELSEPQMQQLRQAMRANQDRRRDLMRREMDLRRSIQRQMEPGVAANNDSLSRYLEQQGRLRVELAQSDEQFQRDLGFLPPVKRVQLMQMQRNFEERVRDIARRRGPGGPGGPGGQRRPEMDRPREPGERRPDMPRQPRPFR